MQPDSISRRTAPRTSIMRRVATTGWQGFEAPATLIRRRALAVMPGTSVWRDADRRAGRRHDGQEHNNAYCEP